ncbi:hypothetical protein EDD85DRAFT_790481 [Armillaria nabsnona]|nr:hypothetical protein EDD85DRAFT_790481 [Armillaria nabsnona]
MVSRTPFVSQILRQVTDVLNQGTSFEGNTGRVLAEDDVRMTIPTVIDRHTCLLSLAPISRSFPSSTAFPLVWLQLHCHGKTVFIVRRRVRGYVWTSGEQGHGIVEVATLSWKALSSNEVEAMEYKNIIDAQEVLGNKQTLCSPPAESNSFLYSAPTCIKLEKGQRREVFDSFGVLGSCTSKSSKSTRQVSRLGFQLTTSEGVSSRFYATRLPSFFMTFWPTNGKRRFAVGLISTGDYT